jgi:uncharacterized repeat protein (TIGR03803 family)
MKKIITLLAITFCLQTNAQLTTILNFAGFSNGNHPQGSVISDGTYLYGMTSGGGATSMGTIFKIMPNGTGYVNLLNFSGTADGSQPYGSLYYDGSFLYGMTATGGATNNGVIFKIKPDGTGYIDLLDFAGTTNGGGPRGSLISDGVFLYGMTIGGGANSMGTIFKIMPNGTGYTKLLDFAGATNGKLPHGSLYYDGTFLYGMTQQGGANDLGTIFKIKPNGTGYLKLLDFTGTNGSYPAGSLITDGTFLYGMANSGGTNVDGVIFKIMPNGTGYVKLLDFGGANGQSPDGDLLYDGTFLYGTTYNGGTSNNGIIFKIKPNGTGYADLLDFAGTTNGKQPSGSLISDGTFLYGTAYTGGSTNNGTVFKLGGAIGIEQFFGANEQISIYPNPAANSLQVAVSGNNGHVTGSRQIQVIDMLGNTIKEFKSQNTELKIDVSDLNNGVYFVSVKTNNGMVTKKIIVQR